jgi:hypothetical protein
VTITLIILILKHYYANREETTWEDGNLDAITISWLVDK